MWYQIVSTLSLLIFFPILVFSLRKRPKEFYSFLIFGAVCLSPIILFGNYPVADEIVFSVVGVAVLFSMAKNFRSYQNSEIKNPTKIKILILLYFLCNILTSLFLDFSLSKIRFLNISLSLLLILIFLTMGDKPVTFKPNLIQITFQINLWIWILFYLLYRFLGIDWNSQQAITYVGSAYAAFVPAVGLILLLVFESKSREKYLSNKYLAYFAGSVLASQIYYSRVLQFCCIVSGVLAIVIKSNWRTVLGILLSSVIGFMLSFPITGTNFNRTPFDVLRETSSSANFVIDPRSSDVDRSHQIMCSTRLIFQNEEILTKLFGYGQDNHKFKLRPCIEEKFGPVPENKPIRPVGYVALITDFGLLGLFSVFILFCLAVYRLRKERELLLYVVLLLEVVSWSLITNDLEHQLIYLILVLDLLFYFSQGLHKQELLKKRS